MKKIKNCRICNKKLIKIINLGKISLVGNFYKQKKKSKKYPINLCYCSKCKHVQISEIISPKKLFDNYFWETGISKTNIELFSNLTSKLKKKIKSKDKILEIASNDSSFLRYLKKKYNCTLLGVDPAKNLVSKIKSIKVIKNFFSHKLSLKIKKTHGKFDYIFARNVLAHVTNPNDIFRGVRELLTDKGIFIIEVPHLLPIIKNCQYDNIFHEHQSFYSVKSIINLCSLNKLKLFDVKIIESQGGSLRCQIQKNNYYKKNINIKIVIQNEKKNNLFFSSFLKSYKKRVNTHRKLLFDLLTRLKLHNNKSISAYGASGKGQALLQFNGLDDKIIDNIFDKSRLKFNRYTSGTNIKVLSPKKILKNKIDYILLLSWNLKKEIIKQEKIFLKNGGKFILPFPKPNIFKK